MKTVLKMPLYLVIETEENHDRAQVTKMADEILFPIWVDWCNRNVTFDRPTEKKFSKSLGKPATLKVTPSLEIPQV